jgi:hypothetical protein
MWKNNMFCSLKKYGDPSWHSIVHWWITIGDPSCQRNQRNLLNIFSNKDWEIFGIYRIVNSKKNLFYITFVFLKGGGGLGGDLVVCDYSTITKNIFFLYFPWQHPQLWAHPKIMKWKQRKGWHARLCLGEKNSLHPKTIKNGSSRMYWTNKIRYLLRHWRGG